MHHRRAACFFKQTNRTMIDICLYITPKWLDQRYTILKCMTILKLEDFLNKLDNQTHLSEFLWTRLRRKWQTKTQSGTKGFSLNACAVRRYYMTVEYRKVCLWNLRHMVQVQTSCVVHVDLEPPGMLRNLLENPLPCMNPFDLVCLFTASAASKDIRDDLVHAKTKGEDIPR